MNRNTIATTAMKSVRTRLMLVIFALAGALAPFAPALAQSAFFVDPFMGAELGVHLTDVDGQFLLGKGYVHRTDNEGPQSTNRHYFTTMFPATGLMTSRSCLLLPPPMTSSSSGSGRRCPTRRISMSRGTASTSACTKGLTGFRTAGAWTSQPTAW